jgi:hypothetical protein
MGGNYARRASLRARFVRMIIFRTVVSTAVLLAALYGGLATGRTIVAYRQRLANQHAERPAPACAPSLPDGEQLTVAYRHHHHHRAVAPECYYGPWRQAQFDASLQEGLNR